MSQTRDERIRHSPVRPKKERASYVSRTWGGLIAVPRGSPPWVQEVVVQVNQALRKILPFLDEDQRLLRGPGAGTDNSVPTFDKGGKELQNPGVLFISNAGDVGINVASPSHELDVANGTTASIRVAGDGSVSSTARVRLEYNGATGYFDVSGNRNADSPVYFALTRSGFPGPVEIVVLESGGAQDSIHVDGTGVGILNASPSEALDVTGNIAVSGTVDGRDVATDGTKLDGIESGATADQSDAEIKTAYENNSDTNAFTDAEKRLLKVIHLPPSGAWANTSGTATLVQSINVPAYWEFLDNSAVDRIAMSMPLPDYWAGRSLSKFEIEWSTDGTNTATMVWQVVVYNYVLGTDLLNGTGTSVYNSGSLTLTPTGTAHSGTRTDLGPSGTFSAGADVLRVLIQRRSSDASDTNTDALRIYGVRLEVS